MDRQQPTNTVVAMLRRRAVRGLGESGLFRGPSRKTLSLKEDLLRFEEPVRDHDQLTNLCPPPLIP